MMVSVVDLKVREIDFQFDDDIPLQWNPRNPYWGNFVNYITMIAPAFEGYFVKATRAAIPQIKDPEIREEAIRFCDQEAQHSKHHLAHAKLLFRKNPGLEQVFQDVKSSYRELYKKESMEFHLGYSAVLELMFGPLAKFVVENRQQLFLHSDSRIASFILWHLVEEFEHRNSAYNVFNDVVNSYPKRLKIGVGVVKHLIEIDSIVRNGFQQHAPVAVGEVCSSDVTKFMQGIPMKQRFIFLYELLCTLLPYHNPNNIQQPDWVSQWFNDEEKGVDMRNYYPHINP